VSLLQISLDKDEFSITAAAAESCPNRQPQQPNYIPAGQLQLISAACPTSCAAECRYLRINNDFCELKTTVYFISDTRKKSKNLLPVVIFTTTKSYEAEMNAPHSGVKQSKVKVTVE